MLVYETEKISQRKVALIIGITIIIMAICSGISYGAIHSNLFVNGDAAATIKNILESISIFRAEIFFWLIILICDIISAWALYIYFKQIDKSLSLLGAWLRLIYSAILGMAITNLIYILLLLNGNSYSAKIPADLLKAQLKLFIDGFHTIWSLGLIIFGFHLLVIGYLALVSNSIPKFLGRLLLIASFCYISIHSFYLFIPQLENITKFLENILSLPMAAGELGLGVWLLVKGCKVPQANS